MKTFSEWIKIKEDCGCSAAASVSSPAIGGMTGSCSSDHGNIMPAWSWGYGLYKPEKKRKHKKKK